MGKTRKRKAREKLAEREKGFLPVLFVCLFVCLFFFFHVRASSKPAAITRGSNYVRACFFARYFPFLSFSWSFTKNIFSFVGFFLYSITSP